MVLVFLERYTCLLSDEQFVYFWKIVCLSFLPFNEWICLLLMIKNKVGLVGYLFFRDVLCVCELFPLCFTYQFCTYFSLCCTYLSLLIALCFPVSACGTIVDFLTVESLNSHITNLPWSLIGYWDLGPCEQASKAPTRNWFAFARIMENVCGR